MSDPQDSALRGLSPVVWNPIHTAPRDGTLVRLWAPDAPIVEMRWNPAGTNLIAQRGPGIWEHPSGELTWSEAHPDGAPTHWLPVLS